MLFDRASVGVAFLGLDGSIRSVNARVCEILGYASDELCTMGCLELTHPDDRAAHADVFARALAGERPTVSSEKRLLHKDGSAVWTEVQLTVLCDEDGAPEEFAAIVDDIGDRVASARTIAESESLLRFAGEMAHFGGWAYDLDGGGAMLSSEVRYMFRIPPDYSPTLEDVLACYRPESSQRLASAIEDATRSSGGFDIELETVPQTDVPSWVRLVGRFDPVRRRFAGAVQDISARKHSELELVRINRALKMLSGCNEVLVRATDERTLLTDIARLVVEVGGYRMAWVGYARDDAAKSVEPMAVAGHSDDYFSGTPVTWDADQPSGNGGAGRTIRSGRPTIVCDVAAEPTFAPWRERALARGYRGVVCLPLLEGGRVFGILCLYGSTALDPQRAEVDLLTELADDLAFGIGHLRARARHDAAEREIAYLAFYDTLTNLPNRTALVQRLKATLGPGCGIGALLFIDLDNFKTLNDTLGHDKGDALLQQVAKRLQAAARPGDVVARFGGDEFIVLVDRLGDTTGDATAAAHAIAKRMLATFAAPFEIDGYAHVTSPSIGVTLFAASDNSDDILKAADLAMYRAKATGRNTIRFFDPAMQAAAIARRGLEDDIRVALRDGDFTVVYQPQVDVAGTVLGAEALVRWTHRERGPISPAEFIAVAEDSGLIVPLGRSVLQMACARLAAWSGDVPFRALRLSVNVSAREFRHPEFASFVCETLAATGADPQRLTLELTESVFADDIDALVANMDALRERGVSFSLDDFGTGYSSLSYLKRLPLGQLKIDQSFVRDVLVDPGDAVIARTIVALGKNLSLDVVAEGVETVEQFRFLADAGCSLFQGFYFHEPLVAGAFERCVVGRVADIFTRS